MFFQRYVFYILFSLTYIGMLLSEKRWYSPEGTWLDYLPIFLMHFLLTALVVFTNSLFLIPRLFENRKYVLYTACMVVLISTYSFLSGFYDTYIYSKMEPGNDGNLEFEIANYFLFAIWLSVISATLHLTQKWFDQKEQVKNVEIEKLQSEIKYLRAQINPHFLFNGLNTIYGNIDIKNEEARNILLQFSDLLRYNLYEADVDWISIGKEAEYLQNYISFQNARSNPSLEIDFDLTIEDRTIKVAPLLFIVFIENAFKFSTRDENPANFVKISFKQSGDQIIFSCRNSCEKLDNSVGIGLTNVRRRLELLYRDKHTLSINQDDAEFSVKLILLT